MQQSDDGDALIPNRLRSIAMVISFDARTCRENRSMLVHEKSPDRRIPVLWNSLLGKRLTLRQVQAARRCSHRRWYWCVPENERFKTTRWKSGILFNDVKFESRRVAKWRCFSCNNNAKSFKLHSNAWRNKPSTSRSIRTLSRLSRTQFNNSHGMEEASMIAHAHAHIRKKRWKTAEWAKSKRQPINWWLTLNGYAVVRRTASVDAEVACDRKNATWCTANHLVPRQFLPRNDNDDENDKQQQQQQQ